MRLLWRLLIIDCIYEYDLIALTDFVCQTHFLRSSWTLRVHCSVPVVEFLHLDMCWLLVLDSDWCEEHILLLVIFISLVWACCSPVGWFLFRSRFL